MPVTCLDSSLNITHDYFELLRVKSPTQGSTSEFASGEIWTSEQHLAWRLNPNQLSNQGKGRRTRAQQQQPSSDTTSFILLVVFLIH